MKKKLAVMALAAATLSMMAMPVYADDLVTVGYAQVGHESDWRTANTQNYQDVFSEDAGYSLDLVDCTAFICEDDFIAWLLWEELSLGQEKKIATHASLSSSLQSTGFKTTSADHSFETTIALAAFNTSYLTTSGLLRATTLTHQTHQPGTLAAQMSINKLKGLPVSSQEVPLQLLPPK